MPKFASARFVALAVMVVLVMMAGMRVSVVSAAHAARLTAREQPSGPSSRQVSFAFGYGAHDGLGVELEKVVSTLEVPVQYARVRNTTIEPITALRFVVIVEKFPDIRPQTPVHIYTSDLMPVLINPGTAAELAPQVVSSQQMRDLMGTGDRIQLFISIQAVQFANGVVWKITPNPAAVDSTEALAFPRMRLPRALVEAAPAASDVAAHLCRGQVGQVASRGGTVELQNEPGRYARCNDDYRWEEYSAGH